MKRFVICCTIIAVVLAILLSEPPVPPRSAQRPDDGRIAIRVVDETTLRPIIGARVGLTSCGRCAFALTDGEGWASLDAMPGAGRFALRVGATAFLSRSFRMLSARRVTLALSQGTRAVRGVVVQEPDQSASARIVFVRPAGDVIPAVPLTAGLAVAADGAFEVRVGSRRAATLELVRRSHRGCGASRIAIPAGSDDVDLGRIVIPTRFLDVEVVTPSGEPVSEGRAIFRAAVDPGRAVARDLDANGRVRFEVPRDSCGAVAGIVDVVAGKRIRGGFSVFYGRSNRVFVRP